MGFWSNPWVIAIAATVIVGILGFIIRFAYKHYLVPHQDVDKPPKHSPSTPNEQEHGITLKEIYASLKGLPPYQRQQAEENYEGIKVKWPVKLFNMSVYEDHLRIYTRAPYGVSPSIDFSVDTKEYPQFKVMKPGKKFIVEGIIKKVEFLGVELDVNNISFE